jgi:hypothetical protein
MHNVRPIASKKGLQGVRPKMKVINVRNFLVVATSAKLHVNSLVSMILIFVSVRRALGPGH